MSWRNQTTHREESKVVKKALLGAGLDVLSVGHGTGTAWAWLEIKLARPLELACEEHGSFKAWDNQNCPSCRAFIESLRELDRKAISIAQQITGRHGDYSGEILVTVGAN